MVKLKLSDKDISDCFQDSEKIKNISHQTIDQWIKEAPYSYIFHFIKAKKYLIEEQEIPDKVLNLAATYSHDRRWLKKKLFEHISKNQVTPMDSQHSSEPINKNKALVIVKKKKIKKPQSSTRLKKIIGLKQKQLKTKKKIEETKKKEVVSSIPEPKAKLKKLLKIKQKNIQKIQKNKTKTPSVRQQKQEKEMDSFENNMSSFTDWLKSMESSSEKPIAEKKSSDTNDIKKNKKKKKRSRLEKMLQKSLHLKQGTVSETYADLLLEQGHTKRAIEMYKALIVKYPEKSNIFASKLEKIEKK